MTKQEIAELQEEVAETLFRLENFKFYPKVKAAAERQAAWMKTRLWKLQGVRRWTAKRVQELQRFRDDVQIAFETACFEDYRAYGKSR